MRRLKDEQQYSLCVKKGLNGKVEVLLDPAKLSRDKNASVVVQDLAEDGKRLVYGMREGGADEVALHTYDIESRSPLADTLPAGRYMSVNLAPDGKGFYYAIHNAKGPRVKYHAMGSSVADDQELFGASYGQEKIISSALSDDGRWLVMTVFYGSAAAKTEVHVLDTKTGKITAIVADIEARFSPQIGGNTLFMLTNWEAPNSRVLAVDLDNPARDKWREVIPTGRSPIQSLTLAGSSLAVLRLENVQPKLTIYKPTGEKVRDVEFPGIGNLAGISGDWSRGDAFYTFTSLHMPPTIYQYSVGTGKQSVWEKSRAKVDTAKYEVKQVSYPSKDGTKVPMFLLHRKGMKLDGQRPVFLTGYGGFNNPSMPNFSATAVQVADAGGVYAIACMRGGNEFGEAWHRDGMLDKKQNTFDDFIAAAEWLIANKYTNSSKLSVSGGSNGGLLVGAFLTQRPELARAVVCSVPLLDMVRYHQFLVARFWVPEYGSSEDPAQFKYIYAYSPYHHVKQGVSYPATMFVTGDADTRVAPLHARKMAALLQWANPNHTDRPVLLHYDLKAGHSAGLPISKTIEDATDILAFVFWQLGVQPGS
jgi:prolyl oligopeptidase